MLSLSQAGLLSLLLWVPNCINCCATGTDCTDSNAPGPFLPVITIRMTSLDVKTVPGAIADDGDSKDVLVKDRVKFKPSAGSGDGLEKRLRMKSKKDGGQAALGSQVQMTGDVTGRGTVAVDSVDGLVDGQSLGFLERVPVGGGLADRIEATWSTDLDGFRAQAFVDGVATDPPLDFPGLHAVELIFWDVGSDLVLQAGGAGGVGGTLTDIPQVGDDDTAVYAMGVEGLGPKGAIWFADFKLQFSLPMASTPVETSITGYLTAAWLSLDDTEDFLDAVNPQAVTLVYDDLNAAADALSISSGGLYAIQQALSAGTLAPTSQGLAAEKSVKHALASVIATSTKLNAMIQAGATSPKPVKQAVLAARDAVELALAQINGFKAKTHGKLDNTVEITVE